ncbi:P-type ATPase, A domain-containing protein [Rozella allomycis CSF55]|uniref:P-type ATPase, A domain-containing protein n=1 Tax=Rozella allomycis (strain CSF55) TaxID=988480 RepID=A0A075AWD0_ROZAC|nr:P-type ATPase, A domain-containing protein [Rozella allomycis CSF55]|eukprot:EPZ34560.1 P-type ATPase, A domain-containing protein [Rozella allomycis CSF55]
MEKEEREVRRLSASQAEQKPTAWATVNPHHQMTVRSIKDVQGFSTIPFRIPDKTDPRLVVDFRSISLSVTQTIEKHSSEKKGDKAEDHVRAIDVHKLSANQVFTRYSTHPTLGLEKAALERLANGPKNRINTPRPNPILKVMNFVFGGFNSLIWIAMILCFVSYQPLGGNDPQIINLGIAFLLLLVIVACSTFYGLVDWKAMKSMNAIMNLIAERAIVTRDGQKIEVDADELKVGDIVELSLGQRVPADLYLFEVSPDVRFDRSILTGETDAIPGTVEMTDENPLETHNLAFSSTFVIQGSARGVVFAIGNETVVGNIVAMSSTGKIKLSRLQQELNTFTFRVAIAAIVMFIISIIWWATYLNTYHAGYATISTAIINAIGCLTSFVPEGLPICVALAMTVIARRMAKRKVLVKNLSTIETVGSMSVLCSDKTGTLTQGKMFVEGVRFADRDFYSGEDLMKTKGGELALKVGYLCNDAAFEIEDEELPLEKMGIRGNSTDVAILRYSAVNLKPESSLDDENKIIYSVPFNSKNKWMMTINQTKQGNFIYLKGAPDVLFKMCDKAMLSNGNIINLSDNNNNLSAKDLLLQAQREWSSSGRRVIVSCFKKINKSLPVKDDKLMEQAMKDEMNGFTVLCLTGIRDPPREDVPNAVQTMREAGVKVFMVTGDFRLTAEAIAKQIGIITSSIVDDHEKLFDSNLIQKYKNMKLHEMKPNPNDPLKAIVLTGDDVNKLSDDNWNVLFALYTEIAFARTTPEQKMIIVEECKKRGDNVVGVTGDGVNDAPALKAADIGLAMGAGSDVAKEAASMVLLNNDFASIPIAIENGRLLFENMKKVVMYVLPAGTYTELMGVISNVFFGMQLPLSTYLMVFFCTFNDVLMSIGLMFCKPESDLMKKPPRNPRLEKLTDWRFFMHIYLFVGVIIWLSCFGMFFMYWSFSNFGFYDLFLVFEKWTDGYKGLSLETLNAKLAESQSIFYVTMAIMQIGNLLAACNRRESFLHSNPFFGRGFNRQLIVCLALNVVLVLVNIYASSYSYANIFRVGNVPVQYWFIPIPLALLLLMVDEGRKYLVRKYPNSLLAKCAW